MALESMMLYECPVCGNAMCGLEWDEHKGQLADYKCPSCQHLSDESALIAEEELKNGEKQRNSDQ